MNSSEIYWESLSESDKARVGQIAREADETPAKDKGLALHFKAIEVLRAKGYSYRDIAEWFSDRGFKVNHVDVWRAHKSAFSEVTDLVDYADRDPEWRAYIAKKMEGNSTIYTEKEFDNTGNELPSAEANTHKALSKKTSEFPRSALTKKKGARTKKSNE